MTTPDQLRRSALFMPASNPRALEKAKQLPADVVIFDLEDGVAPAAKEDARRAACAAAASGDYGNRELVIRINGFDTPWFADDFAAVIQTGPDAVLFPKVATPAQIINVADGFRSSSAAGKMMIWAMMETPLGVANAQAIGALASSTAFPLECLVMGTNDLAKDIGCKLDPTAPPLVDALSQCVLAARAHGISVIDGVYNEISDLDGFEKACHFGRDMGFDGKSVIHPSQLDICNGVFAPNPDEVAQAQAIVDAFALSKNKDKGVIMLEGRMVERLHLVMAERVLAAAKNVAATGE